MAVLTEAERALLAKIAAHESWAHTPDRSARTAPARAGLDAKFLREAGGDPVRAEHLRKAYFGRLALKSAIARRKAKEFAARADAADAELCAAPVDNPLTRPARPAGTGRELVSGSSARGGDAG